MSKFDKIWKFLTIIFIVTICVIVLLWKYIAAVIFVELLL